MVNDEVSDVLSVNKYKCGENSIRRLKVFKYLEFCF